MSSKDDVNPKRSNPSTSTSNSDPILQELQKIPQSWDVLEKDLVHFKLTLEKEDLGWLIMRISEDIERELISAQLEIKKGQNSCEVDILIQLPKPSMSTDAKRTLSPSLTQLLQQTRE